MIDASEAESTDGREDLEESEIAEPADHSEVVELEGLVGDEAQESQPQEGDLLLGWSPEGDEGEGHKLNGGGISDLLDEVLKNPEILGGEVRVGSMEGKGNLAAGSLSVDNHGTISGDGNTLANVINNISSGESEVPIVRPLPFENISELRGAFARPESYDDSMRELRTRDHRVIAVYGPKHSGRFTCAINIAHDLWGEGDISPEMFRYKRTRDESAPLSSVIETKKVKPGTILILEEVFASNVPRHEFEFPDVGELEAILKVKKCMLIVTMEAEDLPLLSIPGVSAKVEDLWKVLEAHLLYLRAQEKWPQGKNLITEVKPQWPRLRQSLRNPSKINWFCRWLLEQYRLEPREISQILEEFTAADRRALQEWFGGLCSNAKLLAMLTYLFGGSERQLLDDFYRKSTCILRSDGLEWLVDPRQLGFGDMVAVIEAQDLGGWIEFKDAEFEEEVEAQVKNWAHLLWSVLEPLVRDVKSGEAWSGWQPRRALGNALGRMSALGRRSFTQALEHLGGMGWDKAAKIAAYALEESVRRDFTSQRRPVLEMLLFWIDSGNPSLMWAAGASLPQVYAGTVGRTDYHEERDAFQDSLITLLRRLILRSATFNAETHRKLRSKVGEERGKEAADNGGEARGKASSADPMRQAIRSLGRTNRVCAWRAAQRIFMLDPERSRILGRWLGGDSEFLTEVARMAMALIFEGLTSPRHQPGVAKHLPFLRLIEPLLAATGKGKNDRSLVDHVFLALKSWLRWESWHGPIFQTLLVVANHGSSVVREKLRYVLSRLWLHQGSNLESEAAFRIAQAVIARAYAMDGVLMDQPRFGRCILVVDPVFLNGDEESRGSKKMLYRHLVGVLEAQVDVSVIYLGSRQSVQLDDQSSLPLGVDHAVPPLLMPALEAAWTADTRLILVLTARALWDLEDVADRLWSKELFVVAAGNDSAEYEGAATIPIGADPKPEEVANVEKALQAHWARALVKADALQWYRTLQSFDPHVELEEGPSTLLHRLVRGLADTNLATGHDDLARKLLCIIGYYAAKDLRGCARLLRDWLEAPIDSDTIPCFRWMGAAGARALFAIHSAEPPSPKDTAQEILFEELATPLAMQGRDGSQAVLRAVRRWIEEPVWAWYLAGDVVEGRGRLLRWGERFAPEHVGEFRRLLPDVKQEPVAPFGDGWESLAAMIERLQLRAALGQPKVLPELAEGETYALIALDASDQDARKPANFDTVVIDLFRSLNKQNGRGLKPVVYRLGERRPVWVAGAPPPPRDVLLVPEAPRQPRLLGPILMDPKLSPERVRFLLVLSTQPLLDAEDWLATEWRDRIVFFYHDGRHEATHPGFRAIPTLAGRPVGNAIVRFLIEGSIGEESDQGATASAA